MNKLQTKLYILAKSYLEPLNVLIGKPSYKRVYSKISVSIPYYIPNNKSLLSLKDYNTRAKRLDKDSLNAMALAIAHLVLRYDLPRNQTFFKSIFDDKNIYKGKSFCETELKHNTFSKQIKMNPDLLFLGEDLRIVKEPSPRTSQTSTPLQNNLMRRGDFSEKRQSQLELRLVPLQYPYIDSSILSQYLAVNSGKYNFSRMQKTLFNNVPFASKASAALFKNTTQVTFGKEQMSYQPTLPIENHTQSKLVGLSKGVTFQGNPGKENIGLSYNSVSNNMVVNRLPCHLTGLKFELAGRLTTQRTVPRKTVDNTYVGSFTINKNSNLSLDFSQYTSKNKLGAFTIKVWLSNTKLI